MAAKHKLTVRAYQVKSLRTYPGNPRQGDVAAIANSLNALGQYRPIVVNAGTHTGRPREVLAGNHTLMAARDLGWASIAAVTVDVDDDQARRIVLADNRTADLAEYDDRMLLELLAETDDLAGTGFDDEYIRKLEQQLADADAVVTSDNTGNGDGGGSGDDVTCPECGHTFNP